MLDVDRTFASSAYEVVEGEMPGGRGESIYWYPGASTEGGQDGVLLQARPTGGDPWIGVFAFGGGAYPSALTTVIALPDRMSFAVASHGALYVARPDSPEGVEELAWGGVHQAHVVAERRLVLFCDATTITAFGASGLLWVSDRLAYDELTITGLEGSVIQIRRYDPPTDEYALSSVDLTTGRLEDHRPVA